MFPDRLKELRIEKKLTQQEMADFLGITRQGYAKYENGQAETDLETLKKLANFFDVSTDYLTGNTDDIEFMTDEEINEEIKKITKELNVWYKEDPKSKRDELETLRDIIRAYTKKK